MDRIAALEGEVVIARSMARALWAHLAVQTRTRLWEEAFTPDGWTCVDAAFDAALVLSSRPGHERIYVEPCRRILDTQEERYVAIWPGGETRFLTREQLLMLGGQPADADQPNPPPKSLWQMRQSFWRDEAG